MTVHLMLCALALGGRDLDGEAAVAAAKRLLSELGIVGRIDVQQLSLQKHYYVSGGRCWAMSLSTPHGGILIALDTRSGRAVHIQAPWDKAILAVSNEPPTPKTDHRAQIALRLLGYDRSVRLDRDSGYPSSPCHANFYPTIHGLRFYNLNPTYAHMLMFNPDGTINSFHVSPALPEVTSWKPRIDAKKASNRILAWAEGKARAKGRWYLIPPGGVAATELGYWKFRNETKARLVWRVACYWTIRGQRYGGGAFRVFVDALTGKLVEPDDTAWGSNP